MKLADVTPAQCSSCFAQKVGERHVDFEVAWDGPVFNEGSGDAPLHVPIDEMIVCEECLRQAGALVDLQDAGAAAAQVQQLEERNRDLAERLAGAVDHIGRLEAAAESRGRLERALKPAGRGEQPARRKPARAAAA